MSLAGLIPTDISINAAIAICAIAFVSATARGFSGFGSALIFMPLASSMAAPRLVAALLLIIDFVAAAPLVPNAWKHADRRATAVMVSGALVGVPIGTYFLSRLDPVTTRWIISAFVVALLMLPAVGLALPRQGLCRDFHRHRRVVRLLQRTGTDPRAAYRGLLARPADRTIDRARQHPAIFCRFRLLFRRQLWIGRAYQRRRDTIFVSGRSGLWNRRSLWRSIVRPRQRDAVSRHLLRPDCSGRDHRVAPA